MANDDHFAQLMKGLASWKTWRREHPDVRPDLSGKDLSGEDLGEADLGNANLSQATLSSANLWRADLSNVDLWRADLYRANLREANLREADLREADLRGADLFQANLGEARLSGAGVVHANLEEANLTKADLSGVNLSDAVLIRATLVEANLSVADLSRANLGGAYLSRAFLGNATLIDANLRGSDLVGATLLYTDLTGTDLTGCRIHGVSVWGVKQEKSTQENLIITPATEPEITVDNIAVAQFVYLLLHNEEIRGVIDTIGKKSVLLLGRFTDGRIEILKRLRAKLRELGFVPIIFNFDKAETRDFTETVRLLAHLSHFVIVDISNPRSVPLELQATVPDCAVPFVPILEDGQDAFSMFVDLQKYDWMLKPVLSYSSVDRLIEALEDKIIKPAEAKFDQLLALRTERLRVERL